LIDWKTLDTSGKGETRLGFERSASRNQLGLVDVITESCRLGNCCALSVLRGSYPGIQPQRAQGAQRLG